MLHKFSAWAQLSNFDQSEHKNLDVERDQRVTLVRKVKSNWHVFPAFKHWLNVSFRGQFEINIFIVPHIQNTTYFIWTKKILTWACDHLKTSNLPADNFKKIFDLDGSTPEPAIGSGDTFQRIPCFDSCQLITTLMCNICVQYQSSCAPKLARKCED